MNFSALGRLAAVGVVSGLASCGGGGGGGKDEGPAPLTIVATPLASGDVRYDYAQNLEATGASGAYSWLLVPAMGTPPPGITLLESGRLTGRPTANGTYAFQVLAVDAFDLTVQSQRLFSIAVGSLRVDLSTPHWGDAWAGDACTLTAPLESSPVTFVLRTNRSGATVAPAAPVPPTGSYVAGPVPARDVVRCTAANGRFVDVPVDVLPDPFVNHVAHFGTTDVWLVDFDAKLDAGHAYPTDFDAALATMGLRGPAGAAPGGTTADRLARAVVIHDTLKWLNLLYLNFPDGTPAPNGLAISFPFLEPGTPYAPPAPAQSVAAAPGTYNVIALHGKVDPFSYGSWGIAIADDADNGNLENITPTTPGLPLGIFLATLAPGFNTMYANVALPAIPVGVTDEPTLRAMLYGLPLPGGARAAEVRRVIDSLACALGALIAHEIGHALGFQQHSSDPSSIMYPSWGVPPSPTTMPYWNAGELDLLHEALPGPGR